MKCETKVCTNERAVRAFWPGRVIEYCVSCAERAEVVAITLGFVLTVEVLGIPEHIPEQQLLPLVK